MSRLEAEERRAEAMAALDAVMDPELDAAVTQMGFIESLRVEGGSVEIAFRLPTFWCSANFAYLMALDMKLAVEALAWVERADVRLVNHFAASKINRGIAAGLNFKRVFGTEADGDLAELRRTFRQKAYFGRQERLLRALAERWAPDRALAQTLADLRALAASEDAEIRPLALRYLSARLGEDLPTEPDSPAFLTPEGAAVPAAGYLAHLRTIRRIRGGAEANAELCKIYLEARYAGVAPGMGTALERESGR